MTKEAIIFLCGIHCVGFAVFHIFFWRLFDWKNDLNKIGFANRGIIQILNLRLIYIFLFAAFVCFVFPQELSATGLGNAFLLGGSVFWFGRMIEQFIFFRVNNATVHLLTVFFALGGILFLLPLF